MSEKNENLIVKDINVLSLFSGCGGMDLGFEGGFTVNRRCVPDKFIDLKRDEISDLVTLNSSRFKTVFANDILTEAFTAWMNYFYKRGYNYDIYHMESIVDLVKKHKDGIKIFPDNVDIVLGGFPCQDFSVAGKRKGFESRTDHNGHIIKEEVNSKENRGKLYSWMKEVVEIVKPKIFIAENVKGLTNLSDVKEIIQKDFASADGNGYIVLEPKILHAADYGVPQSRERVIFIGIKKSALKYEALKALSSDNIPQDYYPYPSPTHGYTNLDENLLKPVTLREIFSSLKEPEETDDISHKFYSKAKYMGAHCQGQKEINLDKIGPTIRSEHHGNIEYRRLSTKNGGIIKDELDKGYRERRLTPRECALIQTFPNDFDFIIPNMTRRGSYKLSPSGAYKVIGNAVPPLLAYNIAKRIEEIWSKYF